MRGEKAAIGTDALQRHRTGWLRPDGQVIGAPSYGHVEAVLAWNPEFVPWVRTLGKLEEIYGEDQHSFTESMSGEDHVPWHSFSSDAQDEAGRQRGLIMRHLYQAGWVRIGFFNGPRGHKTPMVEFEGCATVLKDRDDSLWELCEQIMRSPRMTPVRQRTERVELDLPGESVRLSHPEFFEASLSAFRASRAFKGGIKESAVQFVAHWTSTIDVPPPRLLRAALASSMLDYTIAPQAPRWRGIQEHFEAKPGRRCPPEIVEDAVTKMDVAIPDVGALAELLVKAGSHDDRDDLVGMLSQGVEAAAPAPGLR